MQTKNAGLETMEILLQLIDSTQYTFDGDCSLQPGTYCCTWQTRNKVISLWRNDNTKTDRITVRDYRRAKSTTLELVHTEQGIQRRIDGADQERQKQFKTGELQAMPPGDKADLIKRFLDDNLAFARIADAVLAHFVPLHKRDSSPTRK